MAITYKDIDDLSLKSSVAGTEKLPVSDTQYITPDQIAQLKRVHLEDESEMPANPDANTLYLIDDDGSSITGIRVVHLTDESEMPASPDANTIYLIDDASS